MKTLHLIRHAKSSWDDYQLADIDRPLKQRGIRDCSLMAVPIFESGFNFKNIFVSPAVRAQLTIELMCDAVEKTIVPKKDFKWQIVESLYTFDYLALLRWIHECDDDLDSLAIVGHNPALTDLYNFLSDECLFNLPTCGYLQLKFDENSWSDLGKATAIETLLLKPKQFK